MDTPQPFDTRDRPLANGSGLCLHAPTHTGVQSFCDRNDGVIAQADIERVGKEIGKAAKAVRVLLFGSYTRGQGADESDVDFLVVAESDESRHKRSRDLDRRIRPHRLPVDIVVYTPAEVSRGCRTPVSFVSQVLRKGKTVYAR